MVVKRALVLGGTGMLAGVARELVGDGWRVVLPSRRYSPLAAQDHAGSAGHAIWVEAQWEQPAELARRAGEALQGAADLLVAWVHSSYRAPVLDAVATLLVEAAPVAEVVSAHAAAGRAAGALEPSLPGHPTQLVVLGYATGRDRTRWLTEAEIEDGVRTAVRRAVGGLPASLHEVGQRH